MAEGTLLRRSCDHGSFRHSVVVIIVFHLLRCRAQAKHDLLDALQDGCQSAVAANHRTESQNAGMGQQTAQEFGHLVTLTRGL